MNERAIFLAAVEIEDSAERSAWLEQACGGDAELRSRVEELLRLSRDAGSFLEQPPTEMGCHGTVAFGPLDGDGHAAADDPSSADDVLELIEPLDRPGVLGRLGSYEISEVLGRGGMGVVLRGEDTRLNRVVAVKLLAPELASNPTARRRFLREAQAAAAVAHDHVVTIHAIDEFKNLPYIVMEYVGGSSLQQRIDASGPLELREIVRIARQTALGLSAAHEQGLIHRDIKPANILLENGVARVKITDFGLARAVDDVSMTQTGLVAGTPQYMSPEQAQALHVDHRSDLFSLGCVIYAMCTGRPPFRADSTVAVMRRICEDEPRPIGEINPDVPRWLCEIIDRLLAKDPAERFQSAKAVADLLGEWLAHLNEPSTARRPHAVGMPRAPRAETRRQADSRSLQPARGRRWAIAATVVAVLLGGLGLTEATGVTTMVPTVVRIMFGEGTLVVEVHDPAVSVKVDGQDLVITGTGVHELRVRPGQYRIEAVKDGKGVYQQLVVVERGGQQIVRVGIEGGAAQDATSSTRRQFEEAIRRAQEDRADVRDQVFSAGSPDDPQYQLVGAFITRDGVSVDRPQDGEEPAWKIESQQARTVRLFEVALHAENCMLVYRARMKSENVEGNAYLEMYVRSPDRGKFFSKGLLKPATGTTGWASYETPFFLGPGEKIDTVELNVVVEGAGTVWIKDVELLRRPLPKNSVSKPER